MCTHSQVMSLHPQPGLLLPTSTGGPKAHHQRVKGSFIATLNRVS